MQRTRAWRRHQTQRVVKNRVRQWGVFRDSDVQGHRFHKRKPFDCGNTQCGLCRAAPSDLKTHEKYRFDPTVELVASEEFDAWERWSWYEKSYFLDEDDGWYTVDPDSLGNPPRPRFRDLGGL